MSEPPADTVEHRILDYDGLLRTGTELLRRLSDGQWTDFGAHDPGITLLEAACLALADYGYRIFHPIPDLMAAGGADSHACMPGPALALSTEPVTLVDLRMVILDVRGVRNAWIEAAAAPVEGSHAVVPRGLYDVFIEPDGEVRSQAGLIADVSRRLHACRGLCTDFGNIFVLQERKVRLVGSLEVDPAIDADEILAEVWRQMADHFSPVLRATSPVAALNEKQPTDTVFNGPALTHGVFDRAAVACLQRPRALYVSDVIRKLTAITGVRAVRHMALGWSVEKDREEEDLRETWSLDLTGPDMRAVTPVFDPESKIRLYVGSVEIPVLGETYRGAAASARARRRSPRPDDQRAPMLQQGRDRALDAYVPLANDLPACYGVRAGSLLESATPLRKAQANQLRGYLAIFDQLFANGLAQLAHVRDFLSCDAQAADDGARSYFSRVVPQEANAAALFEDAFTAECLSELVEQPRCDDGIRRRSAFLDHLLARFAENLDDAEPAAIERLMGELSSGLPATGSIDIAQRATGIRLQALDGKREFLQKICALGAGRGLGVNLGDPASNPFQAEAALVARLRLKLGLPAPTAEAPTKILLVEHSLLRALPSHPQTGGTASADEDRYSVLRRLLPKKAPDPYSFQFTVIFDDTLEWNEVQIEELLAQETPAHLVPYLVFATAAELDQCCRRLADIVLDVRYTDLEGGIA